MNPWLETRMIRWTYWQKCRCQASAEAVLFSSAVVMDKLLEINITVQTSERIIWVRAVTPGLHSGVLTATCSRRLARGNLQFQLPDFLPQLWCFNICQLHRGNSISTIILTDISDCTRRDAHQVGCSCVSPPEADFPVGSAVSPYLIITTMAEHYDVSLNQ